MENTSINLHCIILYQFFIVIKKNCKKRQELLHRPNKWMLRTIPIDLFKIGDFRIKIRQTSSKCRWEFSKLLLIIASFAIEKTTVERSIDRSLTFPTTFLNSILSQSGRGSDRDVRTAGLSTIFGGEEARFDGAFEELIDVTAVTRGRGSHNAGNLNTSRTCPRQRRQKAVTRPCRRENV